MWQPGVLGLHVIDALAVFDVVVEAHHRGRGLGCRHGFSLGERVSRWIAPPPENGTAFVE
jgi:hypothetical protein